MKSAVLAENLDAGKKQGRVNDQVATVRYRSARYLAGGAAVLVAACFQLNDALADISSSDVAGSYVWNVQEGGKYASGSWDIPGNWLINGGDIATVLPGASDKLWFKGPGTYSIGLEADHEVSNIYVGCAGGGSPSVLLDLGGHELNVSGNLWCGTAWASPKITMTNGTMNVAGSILQGFNSNYESTYGYVYIRGPQTFVTVGAVDFGMRGADGAKETFAVLDGATFLSKGTFNARTKSVYRFSGLGTKVTIEGALRSVNGDGAQVRIEDGADLRVVGSSGTTANSHSGSLIVGGYRNDIAYTVDNAFLTISNSSPVVIGESGSDQVRGRNALVLQNGAAMTVLGAETWVGGGGNAIVNESKYSYDNRLEVLSGSTLTSDSSVIVGHNGQAINGWLKIDGASATVKDVVLGSGYDGGDTNNWVKIGDGRTTKLVCTSMGTGLSINQRGGIEFTFGEAGYDETPIQIPNGKLAVTTTGQYWKAATKGSLPKLVVNDEGYGKKRGNVPMTLIECGTACRDALLMLATNLTVNVAQERNRGVASVSDDGTRLFYTPAPKPGTVLVFR